MVANVTSCTQHLPEIKTWDADLVAPCETRLTRGGQKLAGIELRDGGDMWHAEWGCDRPARRAVGKATSVWDAAQGGVGVLGRTPMPLQRVPDEQTPCPAFPTDEDLWQEGRLLHTACATGSGSRVAHL